ncbi:hypothetical protein C2W62_36150 [Candidatus Entotheonella serta]|nr:hypothetical protein C2W62_36150 [Candidatus Entotheonella serta]
MQIVWNRVAPLVRSGKLRGLFLEVSYPDGRPDRLLHGHLTPAWAMQELQRLASLVDPAQPEAALSGLKVIITHIKPSRRVKRASSPVQRVATARRRFMVEAFPGAPCTVRA